MAPRTYLSQPTLATLSAIFVITGNGATAVLTFALGIGANSAIVSAVKTMVPQPVPIDAPENAAVAKQTDEGGQAAIELTLVYYEARGGLCGEARYGWLRRGTVESSWTIARRILRSMS